MGKILLLQLLLTFLGQLAYSATCTTTKVGNWSDPTVWSCGRSPLSSDYVVINHAVSLNQNYTALNGLTVNVGGSIKESPAGRTLQIGQASGGSYTGMTINDSVQVSFLTLIKSTSTINSTGTVIVSSDFTSSNNGDLVVDGELIVRGNWYLSNGNVQTTGDGILLLEGCLDTGGGGQVSNITASWCGTNTSCPGYSTYTTSMSCDIVLPASVVSFQTMCDENESTTINWSTASEKNASHFVIEKSNNGFTFEEIGTVKAVGNSTNMSHYSHKDNSSQNAYYRLKQVDFSGVSSFSNIISSSCSKISGDIDVIPNPSSDGKFTVQLPNFSENDQVLLVLTNVMGEQVFEKIIVYQSDEIFHSREINSKISSGIYYITASSENAYFRKKIIVY